jgi:hypothetical protein
MKTEDLISAGDRAKLHLRVAQALSFLSKSRAPSLPRVKEALSRVHAKQPAVAMAIILEYSKRHPLHERGPWLKTASEMLQEYRLSGSADQKEAELARDHIELQMNLCKAENERLERIRELKSIGTLAVIVLSIIGLLIYFGYEFLNNHKDVDNSGGKIPADKNVAPKAAEDKTDENPPPPKATSSDPKKPEQDKKPPNLVGK